ncbi:MAG: CDP-diacylglycerol--glycerol-3-phosphate 3-phosphatidyltransferase [bacterium]
MNLPNIITLSRIIATPFFIFIFLIDNLYARIITFLLIIVFELSDLFDGRLARKYNQITNIGKILDPLADSLFRMTLFLCLLKLGLVNIWLVAFCFYRDSVVQTVRIIASNNNIVFAAKRSGKIKAVAQCSGVLIITFLTIINYFIIQHLLLPIPHLTIITNCIMTIVAAITVWSGIDYLIKLSDLLKNSPE